MMFNADKDSLHRSEMLPLQKECLEKSYSSSFNQILLAYKSLCHHATKHTKLVAQATYHQVLQCSLMDAQNIP